MSANMPIDHTRDATAIHSGDAVIAIGYPLPWTAHVGFYGHNGHSKLAERGLERYPLFTNQRSNRTWKQWWTAP